MTVVTRPDGATAQKVFVCYRREDTAPYAGRIYDAMVSRFGVDNVFMDLDLAPGVDFVDRITKVVSGCVALIVVIGPDWATAKDGDGHRRLDDPADFVRLEVENGVRRDDVMLIPVLVAGAQMPRREGLPSGIQPITRRNALEMSEGRWTYDVGRLLDTLDELLPDDGGPAATSMPSPPMPLDRRLMVEVTLVATITAVAGRLLAEAIPLLTEKNQARTLQELEAHPHSLTAEAPAPTETAFHIAGLVLRRATTAAIVGAILAIWLASRLAGSDSARPWLRGLVVGAIAGTISGLIWALPAYLPDHNFDSHHRSVIELRAIAVNGALFGALIGSLWRPRRIVAALAGGAAGGVLFQLVVVITNWDNGPLKWTLLSYGLAAAAITGLALIAMLLSQRRESLSAATPASRPAA